MNKKEVLALFSAVLAIAIVLPAVNAAVIHGTLYDLSLEKVDDAVVEISTIPKQQYVAKNSIYSFSVPAGEYVLSAKQYEGQILAANVEENITVSREGEYVIDLILFPSFVEEESLLSESDFDIDESLVYEGPSYTAIALFLIALIAFFIILRMKGKVIKKRRKELEKKETEINDLKKVVDFIKKEGGRATQKEIRKNFPQSEAKISLILTELEDKNRIRKIKKGRGNIIILNK